MSNHSITNGDFTVSRVLKAPVAKVYELFADKQAKEKWFKGPSDGEPNKHEMDFSVGGSELNSGKFHDGITHIFKAHYYDIVPEERIIYSYEMYLDDKRISVSLATIEFIPEGDNTKVVLHETGAFLDGFDKPEIREQGSGYLFDALEAALIN
jgi:uncharacterized protein YndB with AHSA1/START domain